MTFKVSRKQQISFSRRINSERGVFVPLLTTVLLGILYVVIALGFDASMVKRAQMDLRSKIDVLCGDLAKTPQSYRKNALTFRNEVNDWILTNKIKFADIDEANLIMPTMPQDPTGSQPFPFLSIGPAFPLPTVPPPNTQFGSFLAGGGCDLTGSGDCVMKTAVDPDQYPLRAFNSLQHAGNSVACEAKARVRTLLLGKFGTTGNVISVKSVYWSPLRGPYLYVDQTSSNARMFAPALSRDEKISTSPGLTIGIGTEMFTSVWDGRYRFGPLMSAEDPVQRYSNGSFVPFSSDQPEVSDSAGSPTWKMAAIPHMDRTKYMRCTGSGCLPASEFSRGWGGGTIANSFSINKSNQDTEFAAGTTHIPSDMESMLVSCINPITMVRNLFLSTIVEMASRNGQLRNMTEILHINPIHRDESFFPTTTEGTDTISNNPALITAFGEDIAMRNYVLPYVFYHTGAAAERPRFDLFKWPAPVASNGMDFASYAKGGWLNPFITVPSGAVANSSLWSNHHALIAGQLRNCYHLYGGGSDYFNRYNRFFDVQFPNADFEPPPISRNYTVPQALRSSAYGGARWDQTVGVGYNPGAPIGGSPSSQPPDAGSTFLTAGELVSILGTTQMCPYSENNRDLWPSFTGGANNEIALRFPGQQIHPCPLTTLGGISAVDSLSAGGASPIDEQEVSGQSQSNTGVATAELRPDLLGFIRYVQRENSLYAITGSPPVAAIRRPGIFPIGSTPNQQFPFSGAPYDLTKNLMSHILLVFHGPITQEESDALKAEVQNMRAVNPSMMRPITIVYFPTTRQDADNDAVKRIRDAFGAPTGNTSSPEPLDKNNTSNVTVYNISPYDIDFGDRCGRPPAPDDPPGQDGEWQVFRDFWECLLTDSDDNIVALARNIFNNRITRFETKF